MHARVHVDAHAYAPSLLLSAPAVPCVQIQPLEADAHVPGGGRLRIVCSVKTTNRTGVEMEALVGATMAGLTVYDMCKAATHDIQLQQARLLSKTGGKRPFSRLEAAAQSEK